MVFERIYHYFHHLKGFSVIVNWQICISFMEKLIQTFKLQDVSIMEDRHRMVTNDRTFIGLHI